LSLQYEAFAYALEVGSTFWFRFYILWPYGDHAAF